MYALSLCENAKKTQTCCDKTESLSTCMMTFYQFQLSWVVQLAPPIPRRLTLKAKLTNFIDEEASKLSTAQLDAMSSVCAAEACVQLAQAASAAAAAVCFRALASISPISDNISHLLECRNKWLQAADTTNNSHRQFSQSLVNIWTNTAHHKHFRFSLLY